MEHQLGQYRIRLGDKSYALFFDYTFVSILQSSEESLEMVGKHSTQLIPAIVKAAAEAGDDVNDMTDFPTGRILNRLLFAQGPEVNRAILDCYNSSMGFISTVYSETAKVVNAVDKAATPGRRK